MGLPITGISTSETNVTSHIQETAVRIPSASSVSEASTLREVVGADCFYYGSRVFGLDHLDGADLVWSRLLFLALLNSRGVDVHATSAWFDVPQAELGGITPFQATKDWETFSRTWALCVLDRKRYSARTRGRRYRAFCNLRDDVAEALFGDGDPELASLWRRVHGQSLGYLQTRIYLTVGEVLEGRTLLELHIARNGDAISKVLDGWRDKPPEQ